MAKNGEEDEKTPELLQGFEPPSPVTAAQNESGNVLLNKKDGQLRGIMKLARTPSRNSIEKAKVLQYVAELFDMYLSIKNRRRSRPRDRRPARLPLPCELEMLLKLVLSYNGELNVDEPWTQEQLQQAYQPLNGLAEEDVSLLLERGAIKVGRRVGRVQRMSDVLGNVSIGEESKLPIQATQPPDVTGKARAEPFNEEEKAVILPVFRDALIQERKLHKARCNGLLDKLGLERTDYNRARLYTSFSKWWRKLLHVPYGERMPAEIPVAVVQGQEEIEP